MEGILSTTDGVFRCLWACLFLLAGCADKSSSTFENHFISSPDPSRHSGTMPKPYLGLSSKINIRLFPILSAPDGEPYPITQNRNTLELLNENGLNLQINGKSTMAEKIVFDFSGKSIHVYTTQRATPSKIKLSNTLIHSVSGPTQVSWDTSSPTKKVELSFRGDFTVAPVYYTEVGGMIWSLLNTLDLEDYLRSVVPSEMPSTWHPVALQAQAIAARTYSARQMAVAKESNQSWDMDPTTNFQSYRGTSVETDSTSQAVLSTKGVILTYFGGVIEASFSSHSGGVTCAARECFENHEEAPYLHAKTDSIEMETQTFSSVGTWEACVSLDMVKYRLAQYQYSGISTPSFAWPSTSGRSSYEACNDASFRQEVKNLSSKLDVQNISVNEYSSTGRVWFLTAKLKNGQNVTFTRSPQTDKNNKVILPSLRSVMIGRKSHLFEVLPLDSNGIYKVIGHGFGHGVGMSQYGAQLRAEKYKQSAEQILKFYYTGVELNQLAPEPAFVP